MSKRSGAAQPRPPRNFENCFRGQPPGLLSLGRAVRELVLEALPEATESIHGGSKVGLALYSVSGGKTVVCGIQPSGGDCLFYIHHLSPEDSSSLKLEGKGKHARHLRISALHGPTVDALKALIRLARSRC